jgi:class III poly(R)-hydroxyalkanoic acid synthase PhaE subunit
MSQDPWTEALQAFTDQAMDAGGAAVGRIHQFGEAYLSTTRELWRLVESHALNGPGASWQAPAENLGQLRNGLKEMLERLHAPVFGPLLAQHQQAADHVVQTTQRWQRAATQMNELLAAIAADAIDKLIAALAAPAQPGIAVTSLRQLHDLWIECGERAYATAAHSEDFAAAQRELLEATVEMRFEQRRQIEGWARAFNLPTRPEIDAIHKRLHELERMLREAQKR